MFEYERMIQELGELLDIPDRLSLIQKFMMPLPDFLDKERKILIAALDHSIILSFCKTAESTILKMQCYALNKKRGIRQLLKWKYNIPRHQTSY